jgi:hypothetical protein
MNTKSQDVCAFSKKNLAAKPSGLLYFGMMFQSKTLIEKIKDDLKACGNQGKFNQIDTSEESIRELNDFEFSRSRHEPESVHKDAIPAQIKSDIRPLLIKLQEQANQKSETDEHPYLVLRQTFKNEVCSPEQIRAFKQQLKTMNEKDRSLFPEIAKKAQEKGLSPFELFQEFGKTPAQRSSVLSEIPEVAQLSPLAGINFIIGSEISSGPFGRRASITYLVSKPNSTDLPIINL